MIRVWILAAVIGSAAIAQEASPPNSLEAYIEEATGRAWAHTGRPTPGSLYSPSGQLANVARDLRAFQVDDLVTVLVSDRASAISKGSTSASRNSSANYGINAAYGPINSSKLTSLAGTKGGYDLTGEGTTSRENALITNLTARVTHVLPNGNLVIQGLKEVGTNSERQTVEVRGIIRPFDVAAGNFVRSDRLANMQILVNGKGVVGDAIRRPNILYRVLLGLLPF
jgi:flagellar L-ring protein FlgH